MKRDTRIIFKIDEGDRIVSVNDEWDRFAAQNAGEDVLSTHVLERSIWDFVGNDETRDFYRQAFDQVRGGDTVTFNYRCDSPDRLRLLEMSMILVDGLFVVFTSSTVSVEARPAEIVFDSGVPRTSSMLRVCSWCKKLFVEGKWIDASDAPPFERAAMPALTHGICDDCDDILRESLN